MYREVKSFKKTSKNTPSLGSISYLLVYSIHLNIKSEAIFIESLKSCPLVIRPEIIDVKISPVPLYDLLLYFKE